MGSVNERCHRLAGLAGMAQPHASYIIMPNNNRRNAILF